MAGEVIPMDVKMMVAVADPNLNVRAFCRTHGISKSAFYKWRARFRAGGVDGLQPRSRRPRSTPSSLTGELEAVIVAARGRLLADGWDAGADSIRDRLVSDAALEVIPSRATIWRLLRRRGLIEAQPSKRPRGSWQRFEWARPNDCWQIDATHWTLTNGTVVEIINIIDDHSRVLIASRAVPVTTSPAAWTAFLHGAAVWGLPAHVLSDNGLAFSGDRRNRRVTFSANLRLLGIRPITSTPFHPQTCGKVERLHQTLKRWLDQHPARSIRELQQLLDRFTEHYNTQRPHRACNRNPPATRWHATPAARPATQPVATPTVITTVTVSNLGTLTGGGWTIAVGNRWAGHTVTAIVQHHHAAIFHGHDLVRELTINPERNYQPLHPQPGRPPATVHDDSRQNRPR